MPKKITAWYALYAEDVIGLFVFNITVNDERYRLMIRDFFIPHVFANHL